MLSSNQFIAHVTPSLLIGSYPFVEFSDPVDKVVICSKEPLRIERLLPHLSCIYTPLSPNLPTEEDQKTAVQTGRAVAGWIRRNMKVLVTCSTGRNRAALVAAIAIMTYGVSSSDAIKLIRTAVPGALSDFGFLSILRRLDDAAAFRVTQATG